MKTAISIPDKVFHTAERLAKRTKMSRSKLYTSAIVEYIEAHREKGVTKRLSEVYDKEAEDGSALDPVFIDLQLRSLPRDEW